MNWHRPLLALVVVLGAPLALAYTFWPQKPIAVKPSPPKVTQFMSPAQTDLKALPLFIKVLRTKKAYQKKGCVASYRGKCIERIPLEEYVEGVVLAEEEVFIHEPERWLPRLQGHSVAKAAQEAWALQAIAARTYVLYAIATKRHKDAPFYIKDTNLTKEIAISKAKEAILREDWDAALAAIKEAQDADPQDAALYRTEAEIYLGKENYAKALQAYETALLTNPKDEAARSGRASVVTRLGAKEGPFTGKTENDVLVSVQSMVSGCYNNTKRQFPSLAGKVTLKVQVRADGSVGQITFPEDTLKSPEVSACVEWGLRQAAFPLGTNRSVSTSWDFK